MWIHPLNRMVSPFGLWYQHEVLMSGGHFEHMDWQLVLHNVKSRHEKWEECLNKDTCMWDLCCSSNYPHFNLPQPKKIGGQLTVRTINKCGLLMCLAVNIIFIAHVAHLMSWPAWFSRARNACYCSVDEQPERHMYSTLASPVWFNHLHTNIILLVLKGKEKLEKHNTYNSEFPSFTITCKSIM